MWKSEINRKDLNFDVCRKELHIQDGKKYINLNENKDSSDIKFGRYALWNKTDKELLGIASKKYNIIKHDVIVDAFNEALEDLKLKPTEVKLMATPNKNRIYMDAKLKLVDVKVIDGKDEWETGVSVAHGMDGMMGLNICPFISRLICSNGMRSKTILGKERQTHLVVDLEKWFADKIRTTLHEIDRKFKVIPKLLEIDIKRGDFVGKIEKAFGKKFVETIEDELNNHSENNPLYRVGKDTLSLYDGLNALTYVNQQRAENVGARVIAQRYHRIESIVSSYIQG